MKHFRIYGLLLPLLAVFAFFGCQSQELTSAKVYLQQRDYVKAEQNLLTAMNIEPENPEVPYLLAVEIYANRNSGKVDLAKAKAYLDMTLQLDASYEPQNVKILREQLYGNSFNAAVGHYNAVIRGETQDRDTDLAQALAYFELAADLQPADPKAAIQIARIYSELKMNNEKAIASLDKAIGKAPGNGELKAEKARILAKDERVDEALDMFEKASVNDPRNMAIGLRYAQFLYEHSMYEKSAEVYNRLLMYEPANKDLYFNLGLTYLRLQYIDAAKDQFETVVALDPEDTQAIAMVGQVYFDLKDYSSAEMYFRQLLAIEPENPDYLKRLGVTLTQQGRVEEGLDYYNRGRALENGNQ